MKSPTHSQRGRKPQEPADAERCDLPADPAAFYAARIDLDQIGPAPAAERPPALKRLGPPPFSDMSFPLMGFLATLYDHVAECANKTLKR